MTVIQWVADFSDRIKQLQQISQAAANGGAKELKVTQSRRLQEPLVWWLVGRNESFTYPPASDITSGERPPRCLRDGSTY